MADDGTGRDHEREVFERALRQTRRRAIVGALAVVGGVLLAGASMFAGPWVCHTIREVREARLEPPRPAPAPPSPIELSGIDLRHVHAELLPSWLLLRAHVRSDGDRVIEREAFDRLLAAVAADAELTRLLLELRALLEEGPEENADAIFALLRAWNEYLDARGQPLLLRGGIRLGEPPYLYTKNYEVLSDGDARVGDAGVRLRVLRRVDHTNVVEGYLGSSSGAAEGAQVLVDRVATFTLDHVWPLMDPALDDRAPAADAAFAPAVRGAVAAALPADDVAALARSAKLRRDQLDLQRAINDREECGSPLVLRELPWYGLDRERRAHLGVVVSTEPFDPCPTITEDELTAFRDAHRALLVDETLPGALEALVALTAEGVAAHEARHAADDLAVGDATRLLPCDGCPEALGPTGRAELSAYLASFADERSGVLSLLHTCTLDPADAGAHGRALSFVWPALLDGDCTQPPPDDLAARARRLEGSLLGRSESIALPASFPDRLPVE